MAIADKLQPIVESIQRLNDLNSELEQTLYGTDTGGKSQYDTFWDAYQENGTRGNYSFAFGGGGWTKNTLHIKYPINFPEEKDQWTRNNMSMFERCNYLHYSSVSDAIDFTEICKIIDFSKCKSATNIFKNAQNIFNITCDFSNALTLDNTFNSSDGGTKMNHIKLKVTEKCTSFSSTFHYCKQLTHLTFLEGSCIAAKIAFSHSPLNKDSIVNIINTLSSNTSNLSVSFLLSAVNTAFETATGAADGSTSAEWNALIATKPNWTISLV